MIQYEQLRRFLQDIHYSILEATLYANDDPQRTLRTLRAIVKDLDTLDKLLEEFKPL